MGDIFCCAESNDAVVLAMDTERRGVSKQAGKQVVQKLSNDHVVHRYCCPLQSQVNESWKSGQRIETKQLSNFRPLGQKG